MSESENTAPTPTGSIQFYNRREPPGPELHPRARCGEPPSPALLRGIEQFNRGEYFEAHETLEALWNAEPDPVRVLYKGILQVGVGCYHLLRGNARGAALKLQTGADYLSAFTPTCMSVRVELLIADALRLRAAVIEAGPGRLATVDRTLLPVVLLAGTGEPGDPGDPGDSGASGS